MGPRTYADPNIIQLHFRAQTDSALDVEEEVEERTARLLLANIYVNFREATYSKVANNRRQALTAGEATLDREVGARRLK